MRYLLTLLCLIYFQISYAQLSDDFSDGNFSSNPVWSGDDIDFDASSEQLRLNVSPAAESESYISTPQSELGQTTWEFYLRLAFSPSGGNRTRIFLVSDNADLSTYPDGYFVLVGESGSGDVLRFYKRDGGTNSLLFSGSTNLSSSFEIWVQIERDADGNWQVNSSADGIDPYTSEGSSFLDITHATSGHFGFWCDYTSSNSTDFYYDDIEISTIPVVPSFAVSSVIKENDNSVRLTFNQNVDETTAEALVNYTLNYGFGNPISAERDLTNLDEVLLTFSEDFVNNDYTLNIDQIENSPQDEIISNVDQSLNVEVQTPFRNIVINEIMADPTPTIGLPDAEYIELYNPSDQTINIGDFMIDARTISDFSLESNAYITLTSSANAGSFSGDVIGLSGLSLSNGGEALELTDNLGNLVDSVSYTTSWYHDDIKEEGGYSLEQINPELTCSYESNWVASSNSEGGSPGIQNSAYDNSPDAERPNLISFITIDASTIQLSFDEPMDEASLTSGTFTFDNGISEDGINPISPGFFNTQIDVSPDLTSGITYTVSISNVMDCAGNNIQSNSLSMIYDTNPPELDRIIVNTLNKITLIFNEELNEAIAETKGNYLSNPSNSNPSIAILNESDASKVELIFDNEFGPEIENTLTIQNLEDLQGNALASTLTPTFTYSQNIDSVYVIGINLLDLYFSQDLDEISAETKSNYSVDDAVGIPSSSFIDDQNNRLIHLAFPNNFDDNKELVLSVFDLKNESDEFLTTPDVNFIYDTAPPKLDTLIVTSATTLELVFVEKVKSQSAQSKENYEYEDIYPIAVDLQADEQTVLLEFAQTFEKETVFELYIDEVKDLYGNEIKTRIKEAFVYDVFEPELDSIIVRSADQLILWFNENVDQSTAEQIANFQIGEDKLQPSTSTLDLEFQHFVYLELSSELLEEANIDLGISSLKDQRGNSLSSAIESTFDYNVFYIGKIDMVSQSSVKIEFNKIPSNASKNTLSNYSLNGTSPTQIDFSENRIATLSFDSEMNDNSTNTLSINNVLDQESNPLFINDYTIQFDSRILTSSLVGDRTVALEFSQKLNVSQSLTTSDFSATPSLGRWVAAVLDNENQEILRLTFEKALDADVVYKVNWQNLSNEFGNPIPNYFITVINDQTAPIISDYSILDENTIWLKYSELLNETSAEFLLNYEVTPGIGNPLEANFTEADSSVLLEFSSSLIEEINYNLSIDNIEDLSDNALFDYNISFTFEAPKMPRFGDLIITEIMADPTPEIGLSDAEYLEIFNASDETISLSGLSIADGIGTTTITSGEIESGAYIILTATSNVSDFSEVSVLGITSFPSLSNAGETISIYADDQQIFSTTYSTTWYKNTDKEDGGWALEMIDTGNPCGEYSNWTASTNTSGGTPGFANSVQSSNTDEKGPELMDVTLVNPTLMQLVMDEKLHPVEFSKATISISPSIEIVSQELIVPGSTEIEVKIAETFQVGESYIITLNMAPDCLLNPIQSTGNTFTLEVAAPPISPSFNDLIITEIMADPTPEAGLTDAEYLEIFNASDETISLNGLSIVDGMGTTTITSGEIESGAYMILTATSNVSDFSEFSVLGITSFPSLSNAGETISIYADDQQIFSTTYSATWYKDSDKEDGGWALEMIDIGNPCGEYSNWTSSTNTSGGTPGFANSVQASNPDNFGPKLVSAIASSESIVELKFDEKLSLNSLQNLDIVITPTRTIRSTILIEPENNQIELSLTEALATGLSYEIVLSKISDCLSNGIDTDHNSVAFRMPEEADAHDIVINEVLFNPRAGGVDFVEIYNNSEKAINLKDWTLGDKLGEQKIITIENFILNPLEFLAITPDPDILIIEYPKGNASRMLAMTSFPTLSDTEDSVILIANGGSLIDQMEYQDDYHFNLLDDEEGVSLERLSFEAESTNPDSWKSAASTAGFATPGHSNSQFRANNQFSTTVSIEPKVFVPDNTGMNDFTTISYQMDQSGNFANAHIYSTNGVLVKTLAEGELLSTSGFFTWDGITNNGSLASVGYYVVVFETFDGQGNKSIQKETVVLGARF